ncbi:FecR family protein [Chitinophaga tropicalis]|uniref:DUF4974 domain-containing protein n=1 Tax=Chitinophaga tropicalis TaxID=2683588 RepID=A0A7K1U5G4_9BACT|nr:FecR family protein [Chitinophaga tropicalis]MVT09601.1 DUF4974 domain-containing protein [Chitinophaga tropicalis]
MDQSSFTELFQKYINNNCTPEEVDQLMELLENNGQGQAGEELLRSELLAGMEPVEDSDPALRQVLQKRFQAIEQHIASQQPRSGIFRLTWIRTAAAVLLILLGSGIWYWLNRDSNDTKPAIVENNTDIAPGGNKAVLTLAGGQTIVLDNAANGTISRQGNATISKQGGRLIYDVTGVQNGAAGYNTLSVPRGGQYQLTLPDGTQVWLNATSSIRYPVTFAGNERRVYITGEAYFEVKPASQQPFIVEVRTSSGTAEEVQVLGTHFNINAYEDEPHIATTLIEGKISVAQSGTPVILAPGQQARVSQHKLQVISKADIEQAMAWKNGLFRFDGVDLKTVMRQLARWYDLEIIYEPGAPVNELFNGEMQRNLNLSQVINGLDGMGVHIRKEGRQLIIMP